MSPLIRMLGIEIRSSKRAPSVLKERAIFSADHFLLCLVRQPVLRKTDVGRITINTLEVGSEAERS